MCRPPSLCVFAYVSGFILVFHDSNKEVRSMALYTLEQLEPAALVQHADALVSKLEDSDGRVQLKALGALGRLDPAALVQHANAVVLMLEAPEKETRCRALLVLRKMGPKALAKHVGAVLDRLEDTERNLDDETNINLAYETPWLGSVFENDTVGDVALRTLRALPSFVTRNVNFWASDLRSRLLHRLRWYRYVQRLRVQRIALYWYALLYRPGGPGHARDVEAWETMNKRIRHV
tara:strand:+ start:1104 stop:1808 length:705 start_codon:yes stop_codon:yes gene_type:complete